MAQEHERRFHVEQIDERVLQEAEHILDIKQGYLEQPEGRSTRVRIIDDEHAVLTTKIGKGQSRTERENSIPLAAAKQLLEACGGRIIEKRRHVLGNGWTIDVFQGVYDGLILAEIEMDDPQKLEHVRLPVWALECEDVTYGLNNEQLARVAPFLEEGESASIAAVQTPQLPIVVFSGGPGSGKSTALNELKKEFGDAVHVVQESATIVIEEMGVAPPTPGADPTEQFRFQELIYNTIKELEKVSVRQAQARGAKIVLCDRGTPDGAAYVPGGLDRYASAFDMDVDHEFARYDKAIVLGVPPRDVYERIKENNPARIETYEQALERGAAVRNVWQRHPDLHVIPGPDEERINWDEKYARIRTVVAGFLD